MSTTGKVNLTEIPQGAEFFIQEIQSHPEACQRLRELGFCENAVIKTVVRGSSQLICEVCNTRIGLHHSVAKKIIVSSKSNGDAVSK